LWPDAFLDCPAPAVQAQTGAEVVYMPSRWSRRSFVHASSGLAALGFVPQPSSLASANPQPAPAVSGAAPDWLPQQDPATVREMVGVAHGDIRRVRELVERQPALANASIDWGYGDWEDALGAAAHTGRREIAEILLAHGARMSIFASAMLGQLDVVKALVAAHPGIQRTHGPHGIPLLQHAQAGGPQAEPVLRFLEGLGDAGLRTATQPLDPADRTALAGKYVFGSGPRDHFLVDVRNDVLGIERPGGARRGLSHTGALVFFPAGAPAVRIAFARDAGRVTQLTIADPDVFVTAKRES
jgi:hypothetical protein